MQNFTVHHQLNAIKRGATLAAHRHQRPHLFRRSTSRSGIAGIVTCALDRPLRLAGRREVCSNISAKDSCKWLCPVNHQASHRHSCLAVHGHASPRHLEHGRLRPFASDRVTAHSGPGQATPTARPKSLADRRWDNGRIELRKGIQLAWVTLPAEECHSDARERGDFRHVLFRQFEYYPGREKGVREPVGANFHPAICNA